MAASSATIVDEDVVVTIGAANEKILVGDIPDLALVIGPAPAILFASRGAAIFLPIAVRPAAYGIEFV